MDLPDVTTHLSITYNGALEPIVETFASAGAAGAAGGRDNSLLFWPRHGGPLLMLEALDLLREPKTRFESDRTLADRAWCFPPPKCAIPARIAILPGYIAAGLPYANAYAPEVPPGRSRSLIVTPPPPPPSPRHFGGCLDHRQRASSHPQNRSRCIAATPGLPSTNPLHHHGPSG